MGRPRKQQIEEGETVTGNVTDQTKREFFNNALVAKRELDEAMQAAASARGVLRATYKAAKAAGVSSDAIARALKVATTDADEIAAEERDYLDMLRVSGIWTGAQRELFPVENLAPAHIVNPALAYDEGVKAGKAGHSRTGNRHEAGGEEYDAWDRGWLLGQRANLPKQAPVPDGAGFVFTAIEGETKADREKRRKAEKRAWERAQKRVGGHGATDEADDVDTGVGEHEPEHEADDEMPATNESPALFDA